MTFDRKVRFETGLKFFRSFGSKLGFLRNGFTNADLKMAGKEPDTRESSTTDVMVGRRMSRHSMRRGVGMGSSSHVV